MIRASDRKRKKGEGRKAAYVLRGPFAVQAREVMQCFEIVNVRSPGSRPEV